jgi:hypothetical protein
MMKCRVLGSLVATFVAEYLQLQVAWKESEICSIPSYFVTKDVYSCMHSIQQASPHYIVSSTVTHALCAVVQSCSLMPTRSFRDEDANTCICGGISVTESARTLFQKLSQDASRNGFQDHPFSDIGK